MGEVVIAGEEGGGVLVGDGGSDARVAEGDGAAGAGDIDDGEAAEDRAGGVADADAIGAGGSGGGVAQVEVGGGGTRDRIAIEFPLVGESWRAIRDYRKLDRAAGGDGDVGGLGGEGRGDDQRELGGITGEDASGVRHQDAVGPDVSRLGGQDLQDGRCLAGEIDPVLLPLVVERGGAGSSDGELRGGTGQDGDRSRLLGDRGRDDHPNGDRAAGGVAEVVGDPDRILTGVAGLGGRDLQGGAGEGGQDGVVAAPFVGQGFEAVGGNGQSEGASGDDVGGEDVTGDLRGDLPGEREGQDAGQRGGQRGWNTDATEGDRDDLGQSNRTASGAGSLEGGAGAGGPDADLEGSGAAGGQGRDGAGSATPETSRTTGAEGHDARNGLEGGG